MLLLVRGPLLLVLADKVLLFHLQLALMPHALL